MTSLRVVRFLLGVWAFEHGYTASVDSVSVLWWSYPYEASPAIHEVPQCHHATRFASTLDVPVILP